MSNKFYAARWVVPVASSIIENGVVEVSNGVVAAVHTVRPAGVEIQELGNVALMPRLVNAHTHLEFSALTEPVGDPNAPFDQWIGEVMDYRRSQSDDSPFGLQKAIELGLQESEKAGVIALGEISTNWELAEDYANSKVEVVSLREVINLSGAAVMPTTAEVESYIGRLRGNGLAVGISPHAPYTVHWEQLRSLCELSQRYTVPCVMHLAETKEEAEFITSRSGIFRDMLERLGMWEESAVPESASYLDYVQMLATSWRALLVHGNYLSEEIHQFLGTVSDRVAVCYCPRTHVWFGHERYRLESMLENGVRVCLGTDSRASNPDLSLVAELQFVAEEYSTLSVMQLLEMVTTNAAFALGLDDRWGSFNKGAAAQVLAVPMDPDESFDSQVLLNLDKAQAISL